MRVVVPLFLFGLILLFVTSVVAPRKSKRLQRWIDERLERAQDRSDRKAGRIGNWTARMLDFAQRAADKTTRAGRWVRDRLPG